MDVCMKNKLDGLVLVGTPHTLSDGLKLANYFLQNGCQTKVITIPCSIDGNI